MNKRERERDTKGEIEKVTSSRKIITTSCRVKSLTLLFLPGVTNEDFPSSASARVLGPQSATTNYLVTATKIR